MKIFQRVIYGINRNTILFTGGLLGVGHETLIQHAERPTLLILFAAMMGLPAFLTPANPGELGFRRKHTDADNNDNGTAAKLPSGDPKS